MTREKQKLDRSTRNKLGQIDKLKKRRFDTISGMIRRNHTMEWSSRKRKLFEGWRMVARRQRVFYRNLSKVCNKSLYAISFQKIKEAQSRNRKLFVLKKVLSRWLRSLKKDTLGATMSQWKFYCHMEAVVGEKSKLQTLKGAIEHHQTTWENIQEQNLRNILKYFRVKHTKKIWNEWMRTRFNRWDRSMQNSEIADKLAAVVRRRAVQKWFHRTQKTIKLRTRFKQFEQNYAVRMKFKILEGLGWKKRVNNSMATVMHRFETFMRVKICGDAFKDVYSYYKSKKLSNTMLKRRSTHDVLS